MIDKLTLTESSSADYGPRTRWNAAQAQVTCACAVDFTTGGEKLTSSAAGRGKYVALPLGLAPEEAGRRLGAFLIEKDASVLNVAGNGIYTLAAHGWTQEKVNEWMFIMLSTAHEIAPLYSLRSGGQTGADHAGLVAGVALGIKSEGHYPKGFKRRFADGVDVPCDEGTLRAEIEAEAKVLPVQCRQEDERGSMPKLAR